MEEKQNIESNKLSAFSIVLIVTAFLFILFAFFAPYLLTEYSWLMLKDDSPLGDTLGGIMNPFIAIGAAILTFLAFYMQFKANKQQREQFTQQLKEDKRQFSEELEEQRKQFSKTQFENQFFEMLRLHKENVNEISVSIKLTSNTLEDISIHYQEVKGRPAFKHLLNEFHIIYDLCSAFAEENEIDQLVRFSYSIFFSGIEPDQYRSTEGFDPYHVFITKLERIRTNCRMHGTSALTNQIKDKFPNIDKSHNSEIDLFLGYKETLGHYYRHLFMTVKFVVNQEESFINYDQKRQYLRILRAQLSENEQALLFYNWLSRFGMEWENDQNKFLTDYRMIHNIYPHTINEDFDLIEIFNEMNSNPKKESNREKDSLFAFEDNSN